MRYFTVVILLLLSIGMVEAQNVCADSVPDEYCDLFSTAYTNLLEENELNIVYGLVTNLIYGAGETRQLSISGIGTVEIDERRLESFELDALFTAATLNRFDGSFNRDTAFFAQLFLRFEENTFAFAYEDAPGTEIELDVEALDTLALFPFFVLNLAGPAEVLRIEIDGREMLHYEFVLAIPMNDAPFQILHELVLGENLRVDGSAYYTFSLMIDVESEDITGLSYQANEFMEGDAFGQDNLVRRDTRYYVFFRDSIAERYEDFDIDDEQEDEDDFFADAAESSVLELIVAAVAEPLSEIYPPVSQDELLGGVEIGEILGGSAPDATATPSITPSPRPTSTAFPTVTPLPAQDGFPCSATIAGEEGSIQSVVHREPSEEAVVVVAARAGQEVRVTYYIDTVEGRWYHVEINRAVGYVHEDNIVLGEDCGE